MVKLLSVNDVVAIIKEVGLSKFISQLVDNIEDAFQHWDDFEKSPRHAIHYPHGVIELMPISGKNYYAFKFVNGHPENIKIGKLTVVAFGVLAEISTGYPLLISEMTLLTAIRTAASAAIASKYLAKKDPKTLALIGTGSQAEFQAIIHHDLLGIERINYFDLDKQAMKKFENNLKDFEVILERCSDTPNAIQNADIIITSTAAKKHIHILKNEWIKPGMHINALGGDCPGKTELDPDILRRSKVVVEYSHQTLIEGELQNLENPEIYAELWELIQQKKPGRESDKDITVFDAVGFALQDFATLKYLYNLSEKLSIGEKINLIPTLEDPKDLFSLLK